MGRCYIGSEFRLKSYENQQDISIAIISARSIKEIAMCFFFVKYDKILIYQINIIKINRGKQ